MHFAHTAFLLCQTVFFLKIHFFTNIFAKSFLPSDRTYFKVFFHAKTRKWPNCHIIAFLLCGAEISAYTYHPFIFTQRWSLPNVSVYHLCRKHSPIGNSFRYETNVKSTKQLPCLQCHSESNFFSWILSSNQFIHCLYHCLQCSWFYNKTGVLESLTTGITNDIMWK